MSDRKKLSINCNSTDCENGEHAYRTAKPRDQPRPLPTQCKCCGKQIPFDWNKLHEKNPSNVEFLIQCLKTERIRAFFWNRPLSEGSKQQLEGLDAVKLHSRIEQRIATSIGPAEPYSDGGQTALNEDGDPVHHAQHATGTCCRKCLFYWHGIEEGTAMTKQEIGYSTFLIEKFLQEKM